MSSGSIKSKPRSPTSVLLIDPNKDKNNKSSSSSSSDTPSNRPSVDDTVTSTDSKGEKYNDNNVVSVASSADYDGGSVPVLYGLVERRDWPNAAARCVTHPEEVKVQVFRRCPETAQIKWSHLPLHAAILFRAPARVIRTLLETWPGGAKIVDDLGATPCHLAFRCGAPESVVDNLLEIWPGAVRVKDNKGRTPCDLLGKSTGSSNNNNNNDNNSNSNSNSKVTLRSCMARNTIETLANLERDWIARTNLANQKAKEEFDKRAEKIEAETREKCRKEFVAETEELRIQLEEEKKNHQSTREQLNENIVLRSEENAKLRFERQKYESEAETLENDKRNLHTTLERERKEVLQTTSALQERIQDLTERLDKETSVHASETQEYREKILESQMDKELTDQKHRQTLHAKDTDLAFVNTRLANLASEKDVLLKRVTNLADLLDKVKSSNEIRKNTIQNLNDRVHTLEKNLKEKLAAGKTLHDKISEQLQTEKNERRRIESLLLKQQNNNAEGSLSSHATATPTKTNVSTSVHGDLQDRYRDEFRETHSAGIERLRDAASRSRARLFEAGRERDASERENAELLRRLTEIETEMKGSKSRHREEERLRRRHRKIVDAAAAVCDERAESVVGLRCGSRGRGADELDRESNEAERADAESRARETEYVLARHSNTYDSSVSKGNGENNDDSNINNNDSEEKEHLLASKNELEKRVADLQESLKWALETRTKRTSSSPYRNHNHYCCDVSTITELSVGEEEGNDEEENGGDRERIRGLNRNRNRDSVVVYHVDDNDKENVAVNC